LGNMYSHLPTANLAPIRVALVEDDVEFQKAIVASIASTSDIRLCGTAVTRAAGLRMLEQPPADVLLVDLGLPDGSGIDIIRAAQKKWPACHTMVSTTFGDEAHVIRSLEAGACGYLLKDSAPEQLVMEIRNLHAGGSPISPLIARQVLRRFHQPETPSRTVAVDPGPGTQNVALSPREREVLGHITKGFTSNEIAGFMGVTYHTVQTYVRRIYEKLKVNSKSEAIYEARFQGLIKD
jgi:DNA-binding NarL/FixJ family response regulator